VARPAVGARHGDAAATARRELRRARRAGGVAGETVENWLIRNGQTPRLREMLWDPLALAALNQPPISGGAAVRARAGGDVRRDPRAAAIALPTRPLHLMYAEPAREYIESHGGTVRTGAAARCCCSGDASPACGRRRTWSRRVISACRGSRSATVRRGPPALRGVLDRARAHGLVADRDGELWFDRRVLDEPFVGCPGARCSGCSTSAGAGDERRTVAGVERRGAILAQTNEADPTRARRAARRAARVRGRTLRARPCPRAARDVLARARPAARPATRTAVHGFFWPATGSRPAARYDRSAVRSDTGAAHVHDLDVVHYKSWR
jgi:hypothetical protein